MNKNSYDCCQVNSRESINIKSIAPLLKLVAEESRLKLLCVLNREEHCVCELMGHTKYSQSLISHHLRDLKDSSLIKDKKIGRRVYYSLTPLGKTIIDSLLQVQNSK